MFAKNYAMKNYAVFLLLSVFALGMSACNSTAATSESADQEQKAADKEPISDDSLIAQTTREILTLFKNKNYEAIGAFVHPEKGVRFSPYAYVDLEKDIVINQKSFKTWVEETDSKVVVLDWGAYDGTGDPIVMPFWKYAEKFVYDVDFLNAEETLINKSKGTGNTIDNREEIYKDKPFTCSYFSGFEEQYEGMDWRSLHLVYEIEDGKAWLIGIIHGQWTI
jgi:hypothetical protein